MDLQNQVQSKPERLFDFVSLTPSFSDGVTEAHNEEDTYSTSYEEFKAEFYGAESHDILTIINNTARRSLRSTNCISTTRCLKKGEEARNIRHDTCPPGT